MKLDPRFSQPGVENETPETRIRKLTKINSALMQRVERSMDQQANAFSLFQTAIALETQVRLRTEELKSTLSKLERTNDELTAARDAAERANRFKTRFFTAVGHDLLQPLHAARLSMAALADAFDLNERVLLGSRVDHALATIEEMLRSILDISRLDAGALKPARRIVSLGEMFASLALDMEPLARNKALAFDYRETNVTVVSDPQMLRRILQNLVGNAVHYTISGRILLAARRRGETVRMEVWDTGPGVPPSDYRRIFEEFQRGASSERTAGTAGFGLGLSIVQRMADALGHKLNLCSLDGRGTCFSLTVPFAGVEQSPSEVRAQIANGIRPAAYGFAGALVVVIDNDDAVLSAMSDLLIRWGCGVVAARDFAQLDLASLFAAESGPRIILADYHLDDGATGVDVVTAIRRSAGEDLPAIIVTADYSLQTVEASRRAGCEVLHKPLKPAELRALMAHMIGIKPQPANNFSI